MCADQARKKFREDNPKADDMTDYTSHYDPAANVCYLMVHSVGISKGAPVVSKSVYDAFEGRVYAHYLWINSEHKFAAEVKPMECYIKPISRPKQQCGSYDEFEELVEKNFGIGE
jgi:hypothetical protein